MPRKKELPKYPREDIATAELSSWVFAEMKHPELANLTDIKSNRTLNSDNLILDQWLVENGKRIKRPQTFQSRDVYVVKYDHSFGTHTGIFFYYVIFNQALYDFFSKDPGAEPRVTQWYRVPKALLLPFTNAPLF